MAGERILFVVNAGPSVGGGHFMRSLNLARALEARGVGFAFAGPPAVTTLSETFASRAICAGTFEADDLIAGAAALATDYDALVFDHYDLDAEDHRQIAAGRPALVVDDLADRPLAADLLLDAGVARQASDYDGLLPPHTELLLGPDNAALSPAFAALRDKALVRRAATTRIERVLVSLGLTDVGGITAATVRALLPVLGERRLEVVVGGQAPSLSALREIAAVDPRLTLHVDSRDMPALTARADLAIGAAGSSSWERCVLALPAISLVLADNQREAAQALSALGAHRSLNAEPLAPEDLRHAFATLADAPGAWRTMSLAAAKVCDGQGAQRTADRFLALISPRFGNNRATTT
ncbi:UDP-2,4-diacetamido-2,4,6-trideoxy-beta-L-altropyranose hydrolase [Caulobacter endophyticus]|uniref:UDP-2,4-diacetamido-2,4, 6-trideoxy-beta-L-altropyranose hydrolase n=1 Tax=Caulobacter endophyticus TaxID=2172652 RepID=A0A2T9K3P2_9CAUL|nr:UDP-2,4-diacetamido-2,4,6-trideoxy-beta-L-altropyranose hydrolase [Caulobacter endophyticus]PVM90606.1 UDP-2,4-diacetamido-2,4,6-trideoxy-beta-L-altropyranose hydrolase [Caulobacter endophyticus]